VKLLPAIPTSFSINSSLIIESLDDIRFYQLNERTQINKWNTLYHLTTQC
jgi:hypothetical protein